MPTTLPLSPHRFCRRTLLQGLGVGLGMLPALEADARRARPCLILVTWTNGVIRDQFFPRGDGEDLARLSLPAITSPLEPWKRDLLFMSGLELRHFTDHPGHGGAHENYCTVFTGRRGIPKDTGDPRFIPVVSGGPSIDHHIAAGIARQERFAVPALHLGCQVDKMGGGEMQARNSFRDFGQPNSPEDDPYAVFSTLFSGAAGKDAALDKVRAERRSLLDHVGRELEAFRRTLGSEDRTKVEAHLTSVREIEQQLTAPPRRRTDCRTPELPRFAHSEGVNYPRVVDVQLRLAAAALACDATRVVTIQLANANGSGVIFSWLGIDGKGREFPVRDHHDVAHRPGEGNQDKIRIDRWYMERCADLIRLLAATREGDRRLLDRAALLWTNHMGNGGGHTSDHLPWVLAGGANGYFRTGRHARLPERTPVNGLYVALANAMGVPTTHFGNAAYGGELSALRG